MTGFDMAYPVWAVMILAAGQDLWKLRISNIFPVALVAAFVLWRGWSGFDVAIWQNFASFGIALGIGIVLFVLRWLGGGDVKLFAAAALWFTLAALPYLLLSIALGGAVLAILFMIVRRLLPAGLDEKTGWIALRRGGAIPYGLAIAGGVILCSQIVGFDARPVSHDVKSVLARPLR